MGADDDGYAVRMKLKHYMEYVRSAEHAAADDSPLYIFDGTFASRRGSRGMRREYAVPPLLPGGPHEPGRGEAPPALQVSSHD